MTVQRAAVPFICIDVQVNPFMAHAGLFLPLEMPGDLFRTPVLEQKSLHLLPSLPGNTRTIGLALPVPGQFTSLVVPIAFLPVVASQLTRDRALMAPHHQGDVSLVVTGFLQNVYLVSLFTGKLRIVHLCASF